MFHCNGLENGSPCPLAEVDPGGHEMWLWPYSWPYSLERQREIHFFLSAQQPFQIWLSSRALKAWYYQLKDLIGSCHWVFLCEFTQYSLAKMMALFAHDVCTV